MDPTTILAIVFGSVALAPLIAALLLARRSWRRLRGTVRVQGTILHVRAGMRSVDDGEYGTRSVYV